MNNIDAINQLIRKQEIAGTREWAEQQLRLTSKSRARPTLKRVNAMLVANGYRPVQ